MFTARHRRRAATPAGLALVLLLGLTACSSSGGSGDGIARVKGQISIAYLQKQGDQGYFVDEAAGAKARADQLGVDLQMVDLGSDAQKAVSEVKAAAAHKNQGVIIVVPDPAVGPELVQTAKDNRMALLTSDDQVCTTGPLPGACAHQNLVARVGFSGEQMGTEIGKRAAQEYRKTGWNPADTRIIASWEQDVTVCGDRVNAAGEAFFAANGQLHTLDIDSDNTVAGAQKQVALTIAANPTVKHWIVWGCNDENVQGSLDALQAAGVSTDNVIGVGLGAYLACKDWRAGRPTGMRAALYISGTDVGALAVQTMVDKLRDGKAFPPEAFAPTTMVDAGSWQSSGLKCN
ncbi:substrate-binding domain-containing protein [Kitasatospora nipponensis]|uniref:Substrate-binding domain-containing protein n=1 Tax=Kitasatospora nipponensis TaxID=258049 RepID=A0ABP4HMZ0_9ACTN